MKRDDGMIHIMAKRPWIKRPKKCQIAGCFKPAVSRQNCKKHDDVEYQAGKVAKTAKGVKKTKLGSA